MTNLTCPRHCNKECKLFDEYVNKVLDQSDSVFDAKYYLDDYVNNCDCIYDKQETKMEETVNKDRTLTFQEVIEKMIKVLANKEPRFGGYVMINGQYVYIKKVIYNDPATVVIWSDGVKTTSKRDERDGYNPEFGLVLAVMKRLTNSAYVAKLLHDWAPEEGQTFVELKDVRKRNR